MWPIAAVIQDRSLLPRILHSAVRGCAYTQCSKSYAPRNLRFNSSSPTPRKAERPNLVRTDNQRRTIFALSTPPGKGGVAVVRISGPDAHLVWQKMVRLRTSSRKGDLPVMPWRMYRCGIVDPNDDHESLDDGLAVYFKGPKSFTTEDVLELHFHSGRAVISSVLKSLASLPFCRPAEPGEFTRRAFNGGRLDLTEVEGLRDLIDAETEVQRRVALAAAEGSQRARFEELRADIIMCLANVEALIDFGESEEIEDGVYEEARSKVHMLLAKIRASLENDRRGEILRSGIKLAIFGPPNAGKSTLLNFLAQREAAIVTPVPGTTRDVLELSLDIGGLPVVVADTAGLRKTDDLIERIGVQKAESVVQNADISLCVLSLPELTLETTLSGPCLEVPPSLWRLVTPQTLFLLNKSDLLSSPLPWRGGQFDGKHVWAVSLNTGSGTQEFLSEFEAVLRERFNLHMTPSSTQWPLITQARHRVLLQSTCRHLQAFLNTPPSDIVLGAEELRYAAQAIGKISGIVDVEDVLDVVFGEFCIGK